MGYFSELAIDEPIQRSHCNDELPGSIEQQEGQTGRLTFIAQGQPAQFRYFSGQSAALRAKARFYGARWTATTVCYWHCKDQMWVG